MIPRFWYNINGTEMKVFLKCEYLMEGTRFSLQISNNSISGSGEQIQPVVVLDGFDNLFGKISSERFIRIDAMATSSIHVL